MNVLAGLAGAGACFGFRTSRLLRFCPLAILNILCDFAALGRRDVGSMTTCHSPTRLRDPPDLSAPSDECRCRQLWLASE